MKLGILESKPDRTNLIVLWLTGWVFTVGATNSYWHNFDFIHFVAYSFMCLLLWPLLLGLQFA